MNSAIIARDLSAGDENRERLRTIIGEFSVVTGDFELASGGRSGLYFEMKESLLDPEGIDLASDMVLQAMERFPNVDAVGGLELGACPIVTAVCLKSRGTRNLAGFYVRKHRKERGARQLIDGPVKPNSNVIILDDVTTKGGSVMQAVHAVRDELNCNVLAVVTIVDRSEGANEALKKEGLELIPLFLMDEFEKWRKNPHR